MRRKSHDILAIAHFAHSTEHTKHRKMNKFPAEHTTSIIFTSCKLYVPYENVFALWQTIHSERPKNRRKEILKKIDERKTKKAPHWSGCRKHKQRRNELKSYGFEMSIFGNGFRSTHNAKTFQWMCCASLFLGLCLHCSRVDRNQSNGNLMIVYFNYINLQSYMMPNKSTTLPSQRPHPAIAIHSNPSTDDFQPNGCHSTLKGTFTQNSLFWYQFYLNRIPFAWQSNKFL